MGFYHKQTPTFKIPVKYILRRVNLGHKLFFFFPVIRLFEVSFTQALS